MTDIVTRLDRWAIETDSAPASDLMDEAAAEIERLRKAPCPHVVGTTTQYCSLTPLTLTDKEREAIREAVWGYSENDDDDECASIAATLRSLLERLGK
jgi:hypothetical protein